MIQNVLGRVREVNDAHIRVAEGWSVVSHIFKRIFRVLGRGATAARALLIPAVLFSVRRVVRVTVTSTLIAPRLITLRASRLILFDKLPLTFD